jgi:formylglycine-generating enzyme required for sulfatase activity
VATTLCGCDGRRDKNGKNESAVDAGSSVLDPSCVELGAAPRALYLPDGGDVATGSESVTILAPSMEMEKPSSRHCPPDMVNVSGAFCIDRHEATLVDAESGQELSPYYPPEPARAKRLRVQWEKERAEAGDGPGAEMALPPLPGWQLAGRVEPMAVSIAHVIPNGYLDGNSAERACVRAGKRLCTAAEWVTACRGQGNRQFPYGEQYVQGACNVFREAHPAHILHGNASEGHLDPRLNLVKGDRGPLLRTTGATPRCRSEWGSDAIYDMVGNLDEWVDDADGAFHGGFYARSTKLGCDARITAHPRPYFDYSLGVRCCK